ncbi:MAG TPA: hypothetical protein VKQ30_20840 [Ktedonobacterales bacterium]|nr:hypothetical protein [Ktedonobacterales bacterium]
MSPDELAAKEQAADLARVKLTDAGNNDALEGGLAGHIRTQFDIMRRHRSTTAGWNHRLLKAQRAFKGEYDQTQLYDIRQFGGSEIYSRVIAAKCRGATSLLREVYLGPEKPWGLDPTPDPELPDNVTSAVQQLVEQEVQGSLAQGGQVQLTDIRDRIETLMDAARDAAKKKARHEAQKAEDRLDTLLIEGGFYTHALAEFISDIPLYPFGVIKGPVVRMTKSVQWVNAKAQQVTKPKMFWMRVSPFDIYWTPGVSNIEDADVIERTKMSRGDLNDVMDLPDYNTDAVRSVLQDYGQGGLYDWLDPTDSERALNENKENPNLNQSNLIDCLEFHGSVQGTMLLQYGMDPDLIDDPLRDYFIQAWLIGRHVIKAQMSPSPRKRHPYFITSFEKVPGTIVGNALPDILEDIQEAANATLRALINNLSIASGPQVVINEDRMDPSQDSQNLYPWKRWYTRNDPVAANNTGSQKPVEFFQPNANTQELLVAYEKWTQMADELSAIPRYVTGSDRMGGAGRTASGLAMLMGNAGKLLQTVAANIDRDVMQPVLEGLYDMVLLTDTSGLFRGDEEIKVRGVDVAMQRETNRQRQLEFLQLTANPIDTQIMGIKGRAEVLRTVAHTIGIDGDGIIPSDDELNAAQRAQSALQQGPPGSPAAGAPPGAPPLAHPSNMPAPAANQLGQDQQDQSRAIAPTPSNIGNSA